MQWTRGLSWLSLLLLGLLIGENEAYNLAKQLKPQGPLGVTLDYSLALAWPTAVPGKASNVKRTWMFSAHLSFREPVSAITDGQLWQIAADATKEMEKDMGQYEIGMTGRNRPSAMTVLAFGHEIILASSIKGAPFTYNFGNTPVLESLQACATVWKDLKPDVEDKNNRHRNRGGCGEVMTAHLYYSSTEGKPLKEWNARVGTVLADDVREVGGEVTPTAPCGKPVSTLLLPHNVRD